MAPQEPLSYDEIHKIQKRERSTRSLSKVSHDFYERLAGYLSNAKAELDGEFVRGATPRVVLLQGQHRNLEEMARDILLLRLRKVAELAFTAVEGGTLEERALTPEEVAFAKEVRVLIERTTASSLKGEAAPAVAAAPKPAPLEPVRPARAAAPVPAPAARPAPEAMPPAEARSVVILRILDDIPPFEGENARVYRLKREDIVTLPREIAQVLVRRKKAVELEIRA